MRHSGNTVVVLLRRLATVVVAAVAAFAVVVVGVPTAAQAATATEVLTLTSSSSVRLGSAVTITATWTKSGKPVTGKLKLQSRTSGAWTTATTFAVTKGKGTVSVSPKVTTQYRLRSANKPGSAKTITVVKSWISFQAPSAVLLAGRSVSLWTTLSKNGKQTAGTVTLQRRSGSKWVTVKTVKTSATAKVYVTFKPTSTTTYRFVQGKLASASRTVTVDRDWSSVTFSSTSLATSNSSTTAAIKWFAAGKAATGSVKLQQYVGKKWSTVKTVAVTKGNAKVSLKPVTTRSYRVLAATSTSASVKVKVDAPIYPTFAINGAGWGHGVGMSQYGAYGMAQDGNSVSQILQHYYTGSSVALDGKAADTPIAVQVFGPGADKKKSVKVAVVDGGWRLRNNQSGGTTVALSTGADSLTFSVGDDDKVETTIEGVTYSDTVLRLHWDSTTYYHPTNGTKTYATVAGAQGQYRHGRLTVTVVDGYINVVNDLQLETEYLYGLAELPSSWGKNGGAAALQAQVVAARSYAEIQLASGKRSACDCNLVDDARDQNFTGWKKENEGTNATYGKVWVAAVDATVDAKTGQGKVLTSGGKIVRAYYFSSSGGATLNSEDVWVAALPYLRSTDDHWSQSASVGNPYDSWTVTWTQASAAKFFGLPDVVDIKVGHTTGGGMSSLTATSSTGAESTVSGKTDVMRSKLGVRSPWVSSIKGIDPS